MKFSESIKSIVPAMLKVQGEIKGIRPDGSNPHFGRAYITLDAILEYVRPKLTENGVWLMQNVYGDTECIEVVTRFIHAESGEWIESDALKMRPLQTTPQGMGSAITYAKRYSISSMLGISSEVDDDGNGATKPVEPTKIAAEPKTAGETLVGFGKYSDKTLAWVYKNDLNYFDWIVKNAKNKNVKKACEVMLEAVNKKPKKADPVQPIAPTQQQIDSVIDEGVPF